MSTAGPGGTATTAAGTAAFSLAISLAMLLAAVADLFWLPDTPATWPYAAPVLLAAARFRPRTVAAVGSVSFATYVVAGALSARPWLLTLAFGTGLLLLLVLSVILAGLRSVAAARAVRAETAEWRAQAAHEELRRAAARTRVLADASLAFSSTRLDLDALLDAVVRAAVRREEEGGALFVRHEQPSDEPGPERDVDRPDCALRLAAVYHADPQRLAFMREVLGARHLRIGEGISGRVVASGEPVLEPELSPADVAASLSPAHRTIPERLALRAALGVPLKEGGQVMGALTVWRDAAAAAEPLGEADTVFLQDLAMRASLAVSNARLHERAQEAIRVRDAFIAIAAHELRTPLTALRGYAQMLARNLRREIEAAEEGGAAGRAAEEAARRVAEAEKVLEQTDRLVRLVSDLLDVSRIDSGKLILHKEPVDLAAIARAAVTLVQDWEGPAARIVVDSPPSLIIHGDRSRLEQILLNLLNNALKFSDEGSEVRVTLEAAEAGSVRLSVRDHGLGIPPERRDRLFQRFYQAHGGQGGGMGIGLYVSRQIAERHGGRIWAEFPEDGGTRFVVQLPAAAADPEQAITPTGT